MGNISKLMRRLAVHSHAFAIGQPFQVACATIEAIKNDKQATAHEQSARLQDIRNRTFEHISAANAQLAVWVANGEHPESVAALGELVQEFERMAV